LEINFKRIRKCIFLIIKQKNKIKIRKTQNPNKKQLLLVMVMMANISAFFVTMMDITFIMIQMIKRMIYLF